MKILFDENVPKKLKKDFGGFSVFTVQEMHWDIKPLVPQIIDRLQNNPPTGVIRISAK